ncbi:MAG: alpha-amylase [Candidatus Lokiarchaeota archaeon]|nr:alpha-amylase [Candidatus Lokiarchaeota archaeon]
MNQKHPLILEINTLPWLYHLSQKEQKEITLKNIPTEILDEFRHYNAIWLMGVWERSEESVKIAKEHIGLQGEYKSALPDFSKEDVIGSPYAVKNYAPDFRIGGKEGLKAFHDTLRYLGKSLILDFVPNHTAIDHPWVKSHPEYYIQGDFNDLLENPDLFVKISSKLYAHGKDPYFPPWTDTLQVNAFSEDYRDQTIRTLHEIQQYCEGVRCDMAMLLVSSVFETTWGKYVPKSQHTEFWKEIIPSIKQNNSNFKFIAEVYWDMEWELLQQGFDYCYDKTLYDRLLSDPPRSIRSHLQADWDYSTKLVRFIENHDEKRAISSFGLEESMCAATIAMCLPGARLVYYGQQLGFRTKLPIQLRRWSKEEENTKIKHFYEELLSIVHKYLTESNLWNLGRATKKNTPEWENPMVSYYWNLSGFLIYVIVNFSSQNVNCVLDLTSHRQDISYEITSLLHRNAEKLECTLNNPVLELNFDPWGLQILKLSY